MVVRCPRPPSARTGAGPVTALEKVRNRNQALVAELQAKGVALTITAASQLMLECLAQEVLGEDTERYDTFLMHYEQRLTSELEAVLAQAGNGGPDLARPQLWSPGAN